MRRRGHIVNPVLETSEIPETMPDPEDDLEGCLSVPGEWFPTGRAKWARVTGVDKTGAPVIAEGVEATSLAACNTRPITSPDTSTCTDSSAGISGQPAA